METNKAIEIYLPNNTDSLNKDLLEKQSAISKILKGTPFEKDTNFILEHLVKVQKALHLTEHNSSLSKHYLYEYLGVVKTLIALYELPTELVINCGAWKVDLPKTLINSTAMFIKKSATELFNQTPMLFNGGMDDDGNQLVLDPTNKEHLKKKEKDIESQITELNINRSKAGKPTYTKDTPNKITETFRQVCAIKIFCKCDGFKEWGERGNAKRNRCIFDCLQEFGYTTIRETTNAITAEAQRNYEKSKVKDAEVTNIIFVSEPL